MNDRKNVQPSYGFPAGHWHSPVPAKDEIDDWFEKLEGLPEDIPGINLRKTSQKALLDQFATYYKDIPFTFEPTDNLRYYFNQIPFTWGDGIFLYCFLRHFKPSRIIEIGSGFSSAAMLDTIDALGKDYPDSALTFIDPNPTRLLGVLRSADHDRCTILEEKIQDVPTHAFRALNSGDMLFVDSSHVYKTGSDLQHIMEKILPTLKPGTYVHFHDIFYPFEYPEKWLRDGKHWNELYILRAFLSNNSDWKIVFFNNFVGKFFRNDLRNHMPNAAKNIGGSLYLQYCPDHSRSGT